MTTADTTLVRADSTLVRADSELITSDGWTPAIPGPDGFRVEIDWTSTGTWVDITDRVDLAQELKLTVGRQSVWDDAQPGTLTFTLDNQDGALTPDNPLSPWWPQVGEDVPIRVVVSQDGAAWRRFIGRTDTWSPTFGAAGATVAVSATDRLGQLTRPMPSALAQYVEGRDWESSGLSWMLLELDGPVGDTIANANPDWSSGQLIRDSLYPSQVTSGADVGTLGVAGAWTWETQAPNRRGAGITLDVPVEACHSGGLWLQSTQQVTVDEGYDVVFTARSATGVLWQAVAAYSASGTVLQIRDDAGTVLASVAGIADGSWHSLSWRSILTGSGLSAGLRVVVEVDGVAVVTTAVIPSKVVRADYAASIDTLTKVVSRQWRGALGGLWWAGGLSTDDVTTEAVIRGWGASTASWRSVLAELAASTVGAIRAATAVSNGDDRIVRRVNGAGRTTLEHLLALARTIGGLLWHEPETDSIVLAGPGALSPTSDLTIVAGADDTDTVAWARGIDSTPTRVTASAPITGSTTVSSALEAAGVRREVTLDTLAPTVADLHGIATWHLNRARGLRATSLSVDLTTAEHDLWSQTMHLRPGSRVTLAGLPVQWFGRSERDLIVTGWTETWGPGTCVVSLSTDAADEPAEAVWDTGRWVGVAGGEPGYLRLAAAVTATDTTITVTAGFIEQILTTDSADYPLDLDIAGERVRVTAAPTGTWTQTLTVVRGVSPTPARAHAAGDSVDIWTPATWAL